MLTSTSGIARRAPLLAVLAALALVGCAKQVTRIDPDSVTDLSGRWNDTDSRLVANALIEQSMVDPWIRRFNESNGGDMPTVIVGTFRNESMEHIPTGTFVRDVERALIQSGAVRLVAARDERDEIRDEREDQQENAAADTRARLGQELGADYILQGTIESIEDEEGREKVVFYQIDAYLTDLESNVRVWVGHHEIKKYIERPRLGM